MTFLYKSTPLINHERIVKDDKEEQHGAKGTVERMDARPENLYYREHVARYEFAQTYIKGGPILDIASGTGYGSELLPIL